MSDVLKKFGKYFLLDAIAQGGMGEIFRARLVGDGGRILVIKRIIAGIDSNSEILQMFKSEIKVTMGFNHPNIVQLYDFGDEAGSPYIAMEMVDGRNLRQFLARFSELKQSFPVELAAYIVEQSASGLHYAHSFKDRISGEPLNIVHRDISPQNVLVSYEGNVKVIDFGIAKANTNGEATRAGVIKGKISYLSPEQISGETLDGRSDVFALGIVLWELLAGRKLFSGDSDLAILKQIEACNSHVKPPSTINPKVPKELDYVVLKALAKQREKRYQTAEEMQRALHKFLYQFNPDFNPTDLSHYAKDLFKHEIVEDRKKIQRLNEKAEQLLKLPDPVTVPTDGATMVSPSPAAKTRASSFQAPIEVGDVKNQKVEFEVGALARATASRSVPSASAGASSPSSMNRGTSNVPPPSRATRNVPSTSSSGSRSGGSTDTSNNSKLFGMVAAALIAIVGASHFIGFKIPVVSDALSDLLDSSEAKLVLQGNESNVQVSVNGVNVAKSLPATLRGLAVGTPFKVSVVGSQGKFEQELTLKKSEKRQVLVVFESEREPASNENMGVVGGVQLRLNVLPPGIGTVFTLNGQSINWENPIVPVQLDKTLELVIERNGYKSIHSEFVLDTGSFGALKEVVRDVQMEPLQFGFLTLRATPSADAKIMFEGRPWNRKTPIEGEKFAIGTYQATLKNEILGMEKQVTFTVHEGRSTLVDERLEVK